MVNLLNIFGSRDPLKDSARLSSVIPAGILLIILAFIQHDKLHYLKFVTPENAATLIIVAGIIIFVGKIINYYIDKRKKN